MSNVSQVTRFFSTSNEGFAATLAAPTTAGATTVFLSSVTGLVNDTVFVGVIEPGGVKQQVFTGTVDVATTSIINVKWTRGTNVDHASGVTIVDYVTGTDHNMTTAGILKEHKQSGSHSVITADSVSTVTLSVNGKDSSQFSPVGMMTPYAGATSPAGWLLCDGTAVSRTTQSALFAVLGTSFGAGDGTNTFNLPDMRGRVAVGVDAGAVRNTLNNQLGQAAGAQVQALTTGQLPGFSFGFGHHGDEGGSVVRSPSVVGGVFSSTNIPNTYRQSSAAINGSGSHMQPTWNFGNNEAHNNMQPYQNFNYIIKV